MKRILLALLCSALFIVSSGAALTMTQFVSGPFTTANNVVVIVMENNSINATYGSSCSGNCSYITQLANKYGLAENYSGVAHHSLSNYLTLTSAGNYSGSPFNMDCTPQSPGCSTSAANLMDRIEASGRTWRSYMEDYSGGGCSLLHTSNYYDNDHNPFVYYNNIYGNGSRCANIVNANPGTSGYLAFPTALLQDLNGTNPPNFLWLTPNLCNQGHNICRPLNNTVSQSNQYLSLLVPKILNSNLFRTQNAALFITWDEGTACGIIGQTYPSCIDRVTSIWAGPIIKTGHRSNLGFSHYSFAKTLEATWNMQPLTSFDANPRENAMTEFFQGPISAGGRAPVRLMISTETTTVERPSL